MQNQNTINDPDKVLRNVRDDGWAVVVESDFPPLAYTVGLSMLGHPELLISGISDHAMKYALNTVARRIIQESKLVNGQSIHNIFMQHPVKVKELSPEVADRYLTEQSRIFNSETPRVVQLMWADNRGFFPGEPGCDLRTVAMQVLGGNEPSKTVH